MNETPVQKVYFLHFSRNHGGGSTFCANYAKYLLENTNIKVGIIDFEDGDLKNYFKDNDKVQKINVLSGGWHIENNSCIVVAEDQLPLLQNLKTENSQNIKIVIICWATDVAYRVLYEKKVLKKLAQAFKMHNAMHFIDWVCFQTAVKRLNQNFSKNFLPIYHPLKNNKRKTNPLLSQDTVSIAWISRLADIKCYSLFNIIKNYSEYKTDRKKIMYIIGDGLYREELKNFCTNYSDKIEFVFLGYLFNEELQNFLQKHVDVVFAMGTACLTAANFKLPVIISHATSRIIPQNNKFVWLFNAQEYLLGLPQELEKAPEYAETFDDMLNDIYLHNKKEEYAQKTFLYAQEKHGNSQKCGELLLNAINRTTLKYEHIKDIFHYMPYINLYVQTISVCGIKICQKKTFYNTTKYYLFGIPILKMKTGYNEKIFYLGPLKILKYKCFGRFSYPNHCAKNLIKPKQSNKI